MVRSNPPRLLIERVAPELDAGRFAAKRIAGDVVVVSADVIKDGHDVLAARVRFRGPGDRGWRTVPMHYDYDGDRWAGRFTVDRPGRWQYTVDAWPDEFATWRSEIEKKIQAGQDVGVELLEGAALVEGAAARAPRKAADALGAVARRLRDERALPERRFATLDADLITLVAAHPDLAHAVSYPRVLELIVERERARFGAWYEFFPRSEGGLAAATARLARIADLGFDVVYLPPVHPIGRTFRKGPNNSLEASPGDPGSPWAIGSADGGHTAIEPSLGTLADFDRFVARARELGMEVALDYALQCSPDHPWVHEHPEWFFHRPDGTIKYAENPPKKYQDIYPLHFWCDDRETLWHACLEIFRFWMDHGIRIFRVDNPHTKPLAFWEWVIGEIRRTDPDVVFLAEAFTRPKRLQALAKLGFSQSYTYFTWRNDAASLRDYLVELTQTEVAEYLRPNFFANTPDILHEYLQTGGRPAFRVRLVLAATLSPTYGIYSGFELCENVPVRTDSEEYLDSEKYQLRPRDYDAAGNINDDVAFVNRLRRENPALRLGTNVAFHHSENPNVAFYSRRLADGSNDLLIAVNLDPATPQEAMVHVPLAALGIAPEAYFQVTDLLSGARYTWQGERNYVRLDPAVQVAHVLRVERSDAFA